MNKLDALGYLVLHKLSLKEAEALILFHKRNLTTQQLTNRLGKAKSTASGIIEKLKLKGLIEFQGKNLITKSIIYGVKK